MRPKPVVQQAHPNVLARRRIGSATALVRPGGAVEFDVEGSLARLMQTPVIRAEMRHDNPHFPVSSRRNAERAMLFHEDCDPMQCATRVAAVIVSANDFEFFRDRGR
ncbi:hypothetical protein [Nocardia sp. NPDC052566]|uniref:hypothetical protein n=1 Tax=Nocardia sp. NPDC052566 TaxID=3364330 RepID=UPI0037CBC4A7